MRIRIMGLEFDAGTTAVSAPLATGAVITVRLSPDRTAADITIDGNLPSGVVKLSARFEVVTGDNGLTGQVKRLMTVSAGSTLTVTVRSGVQAMTATLTQQTVRVADPPSGRLGFVFDVFSVQPVFRSLPINQVLQTLDFTSDKDWSGPWMAVVVDDASAASGLALSILPADGVRTALRFDDSFKKKGPKQGLLRTQFLNLEEVRCVGDQIRLVARPVDHALFVHPDVLDTRKPGENGNDLLHQHALVNGELHIVVPVAGNAIAYWKARRHELQTGAVMLAFGLADQHGHPLALEADEFPLGFRAGTNVENIPVIPGVNPTPDILRRWEMTIRGVQVLPPAPEPIVGVAAAAAPATLNVALRSLDPAAVDDGYDDNAKWWLNGRDHVVLHAEAPLHIHNLAKGTFIARAATPQGPGVRCTMLVDRVHHGDAMIFALTHLEIGEDLDWVLHVQTEERDYLAGVALRDPAVGVRSAPRSVAAGRLVMPLIDTSYALANLVEEGGSIQRGAILTSALPRLALLDASLVSGFQRPSIDGVRHLSGFALSPDRNHTVHEILTRPPGRTSRAAETARSAPRLEAKDVEYLHGGERSAAADAERGTTLALHAAFALPHEEFAVFWNVGWLLDATVAQARRGLREYLGDARPQLRTDSADEKAVATQLVAAAREILVGARRVPGFGTEQLNIVRAIVGPMTVEQFVAVWNGQAVTPELDRVNALLDAVWTPSTEGRYRNMLAALMDPNERGSLQTRLGAAAFAVLVAAHLHPTLTPDELRNFLERDVLKGVLSRAPYGLDELLEVFASVWKTSPALEEMRRRYGFELTGDVYRRLIAPPPIGADEQVTLELLLEALPSILVAESLVSRLADSWRTIFATQLTLPLLREPANRESIRQAAAATSSHFAAEYLSGLRTEPPEYILLTKRFNVPGADNGAQHRELWNTQFRFCGFGDQLQEGASDLKKWDFFIDAESTVIVKLTGARAVTDIVREVHAAYSSPARANPLGLTLPVDAFLARLDAEICVPTWRGILIVNPVASFRRDLQLKNLAGLDQLGALYVAISGGIPERQQDDIDVFAAISQLRTADPPEPAAFGDVSLALTKFDATIRHTKLVSAEVVFELDIHDLWGKRPADDPDFRPDAIEIVGSVHTDSSPTGTTTSLEFTARLPKPVHATIDMAFIHEFVFRAMRVGLSDGRTSIEIDGEIVLQPWKVPGTDVALDVGKDATIDLKGFRILLPRFGQGPRVRIGSPRMLSFQFPAISFSLPHPRALSLWAGIELKPLGMGIVRSLADDAGAAALTALKDGYLWLEGFGHADAQIRFPYLRCEIDFGKLPHFGGTHLSSLSFEVILGLIIENNRPRSVAIGIAGVDGKKITLDLFGVLKLTIEQLRLGQFDAWRDDASAIRQRVTALYARDLHLSLLGWAPIPDDELSFMFMQQIPASPTDAGADHRGFLAWYAARQPGGFLKLFWAVLAENLIFETRLLNYLIDRQPDDHPESILDQLVEDIDGPHPRVHATVDSSAGWMFGLSMGLGTIVEDASLVLHDQHYYGIRLRGKFVALLTGADELSLSYIPGPTRDQDRFRTSFRIPALDMLGVLRSGELALEWAFNWSWLADFGFPWKQGSAYLWERAFSVPMGIYEAKFGLYFERRVQPAPDGSTDLVLGAGVGLYVGYHVGAGSPGKFIWAEAGIGIFAILEGHVRLSGVGNAIANPLKASVKEVVVRGVIGLYAYGEGGIELWVISARFRVSVQAALMGELHYLPGANSTLAYAATLNASYFASVRVGCGFFHFTFTVQGSIGFEVAGQLVLN